MVRALQFTAALALCAGMANAAAEPLFGVQLRDGGTVARRMWQPEAASTTVSGRRLSAGVAMGLRGSVGSTLGSRVAPAISLDLAHDSSVWLMPRTDGAGTMLVFQLRN